MDQFVQSVGTAGGTSPFGTPCNPSIVMDYYDGNTVTAFWNYAQRYAMSDNSFSPTFGPSAPGAVNLVSGDTGSVDMTHTANNPSIATSAKPNADLTADGTGGYSLTSDAQPYWDDCSTRDAVALNGKNIGDELNAAGLSWGWFQGGQAPTTTFAAAAAATGHAGQSTATFIPNEFSGSFTGKVMPPHASNQALCDAVHPVGLALGGTGPVRLQGRLHRPSRTVRLLRLDGEPAPSDRRNRRVRQRHDRRAPGRSGRTRSRTSAACRSSTRRTTSTT